MNTLCITSAFSTPRRCVKPTQFITAETPRTQTFCRENQAHWPFGAIALELVGQLISQTEETGIHQKPVGQSSEQSNNEDYQCDDFVGSGVWFTGPPREKEQEHSSDRNQGSKGRKLHRVFALCVELIPIPVNESTADENKQDCEDSSLQIFHVGSLV